MDSIDATLVGTIVIAAPLTGAILAALVGVLGNVVALTTTVVMAGAAAALAVTVGRHGPFVAALGGWPAPLGIRWSVDGLDALLLLTTALVGMAVAAYAAAVPRMPRAFWPLFLFEIAALAALFMSGDIFNIYVALELSSLAAVALVAQGRTAKALAAAIRYLLVTLAGAITYLLGVGLLYAGYGALDMQTLSESIGGQDATAWLALALITAGLSAKAALFPLHTWLPAAHGSAPAPASALLSALVVEGSLFALLRIWLMVFGQAAVPMPERQALGVIGCTGLIWGGLLALRQARLKMLLAYSTISQLGFAVMVVPLTVGATDRATFAWEGCGLFLVAHAFAKSALFLGVDLIRQAAGHDRVNDIRGTAQHMPMTMSALALGGLTLIGLPPSGGFVAKWLLIEAGLASGQWWWAVAIAAGSLFTAAYLFRPFANAFSSQDVGVFAPVSRRQETLVLLLAAVSFGLGLVAAGPLGLMAVGAPAPNWGGLP